MAELPLTTTKLLDRLRATRLHGDQSQPGDAWEEIDARYRPVLIGFARSLGLTQADAEDAAQWTLAEFAAGIRAGSYERGKGRLRSWVMGIARHRVQMMKRTAARRREGPVDPDRTTATIRSDPHDTPDEATLSVIWERELERTIFARAWRMAQDSAAPQTIRAFELVVMREIPPEAAAAECGISVESVYAAKLRVTRLLQQLTAQLTARYTEDE